MTNGLISKMWTVEYLAAVRFFAPAAASARAIAQPAVAKGLKAPLRRV